MTEPETTPATAAAYTICRATYGNKGCRCEKAGKGHHCDAMEQVVRNTMIAAGLSGTDIMKILTGPVRVSRQPARKGGAK